MTRISKELSDKFANMALLSFVTHGFLSIAACHASVACAINLFLAVLGICIVVSCVTHEVNFT